jgi:hypothetical protein
MSIATVPKAFFYYVEEYFWNISVVCDVSQSCTCGGVTNSAYKNRTDLSPCQRKGPTSKTGTHLGQNKNIGHDLNHVEMASSNLIDHLTQSRYYFTQFH